MISIICPVYNCEKYITQCVESVINQTNKKWELILVDDGSTDGSKDICDFFAKSDERITVIHKINGGQMNARIDGIKKSIGEYVIFLDSDDLLEKDAIQILEKEISLNNNVDAFIFNAKIFPLSPKRKQIPYVTKGATIKGKKDIFQFAFGKQMFGYLWMYCFKRRTLINAIKLNNPLKDIRYTEDGAFVYFVLSCCDIVQTLNVSLYLYRDNPDSITHNLSPKDRRDRFLVYNFIYSNIYFLCDDFYFDDDLSINLSWILFSYLEHQKDKVCFKTAFKECRNSFIFKYICKKSKTKNKRFKIYRLLLKLKMPLVFYKILVNKNE